MNPRPPAPPPVAPSVASAPVAHNPHYERIGGEATITLLVDRFYAHMSEREDAQAIRAMHGPDLRDVKRVLVNYLVEWMGGPQRYSTERGHPRLRRKHLSFRIGQAERDAWMVCMRAALTETVSDDNLRRELDNAFFKTADFLRNDQGTPHEHSNR
ncbi:group II truncated hemoglobin [Methyloversatilis thermotolerans]|uniref:group II truncated hemoglobin n=1 Tax=Methyloversatilis thermotolerans TaxID=1346290 RepID=UPI00058CCA6D|nr:group II truncated hemoglobin [Methyloversatilis thermotolerans]